MINAHWFGEGNVFERHVPLEEASERLRRKVGILWIDIEAPTKEDLHFLSERFKFHPLALKACAQHNSRPGVECFDSYTFVVVRGVDWPENSRRFTTNQLAVFFGERHVVTCHDKKMLCVRDALERCEKVPDQVVSRGTDFILYEILDIMAMRYLHALDRLEIEIEHVEEQILAGTGQFRLDTSSVSVIRWNILHLKRVVSPLRDTVNMLARGDSPHISEKAQVYFRNVHDQMLRVTEALDTYREIVTDLRDTHLMMVSTRMNEIMKVLTVITTIALPLTVISGIYGMNFRYMPELSWQYGYFIVLGIMILMAFVTAVLLRRKKWL